MSERQKQGVDAFLECECVRAEGTWLPAFDLYQRYRRWAQHSGEVPVTQRALGMRLRELGYIRGRRAPEHRSAWYGLRLLHPVEGEAGVGDGS